MGGPLTSKADVAEYLPRCPATSVFLFLVHRSNPKHVVSGEMAVSMIEPDESLVADPRGSLTPAQMVDQKLLALLGNRAASLQSTDGSRRWIKDLGPAAPSPIARSSS